MKFVKVQREGEIWWQGVEEEEKKDFKKRNFMGRQDLSECGPEAILDSIPG